MLSPREKYGGVTPISSPPQSFCNHVEFLFIILTKGGGYTEYHLDIFLFKNYF